MNAMTRERALMQSGEMRQGSQFGQGQMVASDYGLSPEIVFQNSNAGGASASLGGLVGGRAGGLLAAIGGSMNTKEASALLTLIDNRSGVQVAASEGSAAKTDFGAMGQLLGGSGGARMGGYSNTAEGKVIAAAFMDAFNQMVQSLRNYRAQTVKGQGLGGGGRLSVDGAAPPSQTSAARSAAAGGPANAGLSLRDAQARPEMSWATTRARPMAPWAAKPHPHCARSRKTGASHSRADWMRPRWRSCQSNRPVQ